jgi:indole-3-glycerol phosphate synthase
MFAEEPRGSDSCEPRPPIGGSGVRGGGGAEPLRAGTVLDRIVDARRAAVARARAEVPLRELQRRVAAAPRRSGRFVQALQAVPPGRLGVIAEVKRASPAKGELGSGLDAARLAEAYARGGAVALSVLTEPEFFHALPDDLARARQAAGLPVLRKDFVVDPWQLYETVLLGADAVLLLVVVLGERTPELAALALELGLEPFVEVHTAAEMAIALASPARIIGINNRDLRTFEVDPTTALRLGPLARRAGRLPAALSGISGPGDLRGLRAAGVRAVLVGESLVRAPDPEAAVRALAEAQV